MWRTGACSEQFESEEDGDLDVCSIFFFIYIVVYGDFVIQLSPFLEEKGEYGLNIDTDVALWLDSRQFEYKHALHQACGFVIRNSKLHDEFDSFKRKNIQQAYNLLPCTELLDLWLASSQGSQYESIVEKFGKRYIRLHDTEVDHLCRWVL